MSGPCPLGTCEHPQFSHDWEEPGVRPMCCVDGCPCGKGAAVDSLPVQEPEPAGSSWVAVDQLVRAAAEAIHGSPAYGPASMRKARDATVAGLRVLIRYFTAEAEQYRRPGSEQVIETYEAVLHDLIAAVAEIEEVSS